MKSKPGFVFIYCGFATFIVFLKVNAVYMCVVR